jgi:cytochrome c2
MGANSLSINKSQNEKNVPLNLYYLVWDNIRSPECKTESASYWPYQVISVDLISFEERFPKIAPLSKRDTAIKNGFSLYRKYCMNCHTIGAEGGKKGPDLAGMTKRYFKSWLAKFIGDPRSVRQESTMAQFNLNLKNRDQIINSIIFYLETK